MQRYEISIPTAYHQLLVLDSADQNDEMSKTSAITDEELRIKIKSLNEVLVVYTARDEMAQVAIEIHGMEPSVDLSEWDHVVECGLSVPSKLVYVMEWNSSDTYAEIKLEFAEYRVRMHQGDLNTISDDEREGKEHYLLTFWPSLDKDLVVLKQYEHLN